MSYVDKVFVGMVLGAVLGTVSVFAAIGLANVLSGDKPDEPEQAPPRVIDAGAMNERLALLGVVGSEFELRSVASDYCPKGTVEIGFLARRDSSYRYTIACVWKDGRFSLVLG